MGAYLRKPSTDKTSDSGEYTYCGRKIIYASTAMQGWRISMEDAHSVVPHFDVDSSLFAVYDGHGGKEVAVYCANKMGEMIKSTGAYKNGDMTQALKVAFVDCDKKLLLPEVSKELKRIANDNRTDENDSAPEDIDELMTEATMPLKMLMERYGKDKESTETSDDSDEGAGAGGQEEGGSGNKEDGVKNILQMLCDNAGIEIEFEDSDGSESETEPSHGPEDSDVASEEESSNPSSHDTSHDVSHDPPSSPPPTKIGDSAPSSLTALLQSRPGKSLPEVSKMETMEEERLPSLSKATPPNNPCEKDSPTETVSEPAVNSDTNEAASTTDTSRKSESSSVDLDSEKSLVKKTTEYSSEVPNSILISPEKSKGLMDLLTAGVDNGSPVRAVEGEVHMQPHGSRKRPHPPDNEENVLLSPQTFCKRRETSEEGHESGTTAVVCLLRGSDVFVANAGDSRCVMSSRGKAVELSFDHKPTDPLELERIKRAGGRVGADGRVNRGLNLSRAIGDHFYKQEESLPLEEQMISPLPDIETAVLDENSEFIVLACDGIWNCKTSQEVIDYVGSRLSGKTEADTSQQDLIAICEALCDECLAKNTDNDGTGCDNMTCILVLLKSLKQDL